VEADGERLGGCEDAAGFGSILVAGLAGEAAGDQRHRLVQIDDPAVRDAGVGVLAAFDQVVGPVRDRPGDFDEDQHLGGA
jgi:hypothetical protein